MADRNPNVPQIGDPELIRDYMARFRVLGRLGEMNVSDTVIPVVLFGSIRGLEQAVFPPSFEIGNIASSDTISAGIGALLATSGPLAAGTYDFSWAIAVQLATNVSWHVQVNLVDDLVAVQDILDFCTPTTGIAGNGAGHRVEAQFAVTLPLNWAVEIRVGAVAPTVNSRTQVRLAWAPRSTA